MTVTVRVFPVTLPGAGVILGAGAFLLLVSRLLTVRGAAADHAMAGGFQTVAVITLLAGVVFGLVHVAGRR